MVRSWWSAFILLYVLSCVPELPLSAPARAQAVVSSASRGPYSLRPPVTSAFRACPPDVAVLGGDLSAAGRAEVLVRLGIAPGATFLRESLADEQRQAGGLIPPELLGIAAISSGRLLSLSTSAGVTVHTDASITLDTAGMYADALMIAGLRHAAVWISAPAAAPALGTTALLGLLQAAQVACHDVPAERARLAIRALVLTSHVAQAYGAAAASTLLHAALHRFARPRATASSAVDAAIISAGTPLRPVTRAALVALLSDLAVALRVRGGWQGLPTVRVLSPHLATAGPLAAQPAMAAGKQGVQQGTAVAVTGGVLTLTTGPVTRRLSQQASHLVVTRNGRFASLQSVQPGDTVTVRTDARGTMTRLDAVGPVLTPPTALPSAPEGAGVVISATPTLLTYSVAGDPAVRQARAWAGLIVVVNGRDAVLASVRPGDRITVTMGPHGRPRLIQAWSGATGNVAPPAAVRPPALLRQAWPLILLALLVILGVLLLGLRALPGVAPTLPFAIMERHPSLTSRDAAPPATCELVRGARVLCPDGEVGPLLHVVVRPRTGALVRLVVRVRDEASRELPAYLIAATSSSVVRLTLPYSELEHSLQLHALFSPRRYKRLPRHRRRPPDNAPLLQATADTLRVEIEGAPRL